MPGDFAFTRAIVLASMQGELRKRAKNPDECRWYGIDRYEVLDLELRAEGYELVMELKLLRKDLKGRVAREWTHRASWVGARLLDGLEGDVLKVLSEQLLAAISADVRDRVEAYRTPLAEHALGEQALRDVTFPPMDKVAAAEPHDEEE